MALKLYTPPSVEPVTLDEAKTHLKQDSSDDDLYISGLIAVARQYCEEFQRRAYVTQTWELWLDQFPPYDQVVNNFHSHIDIPFPPLASISSVKYYLTDDTEQILD